MIERIIKALLKSKIVSFELIYCHGLVSGITSLSVFLLGPKGILLAKLARSMVLKNCFLLLSGNMFWFFINAACKI